jgi:ADP-ribose pyrophosphatase YjhB (NUDIX family)
LSDFVLTGGLDLFPIRVFEGVPQLLTLLQGPHVQGAGSWQVVRGVRREEETMVQASIRHLRQECGLVPQEFYCTGTVSTVFNPHADCIRLLPAFVAMIEGDPEVILSEEHVTGEWVDFEEAFRRLPPEGYHITLEIIRKRLRNGRLPKKWQLDWRDF